MPIVLLLFEGMRFASLTLARFVEDEVASDGEKGGRELCGKSSINQALFCI
jgi:hypothetical protein